MIGAAENLEYLKSFVHVLRMSNKFAYCACRCDWQTLQCQNALSQF